MHGFPEGTFFLAEFVVGGLQTVNADAHVVVAYGFDLADVFFGDQGAVGRKAHVKAHFLGPVGNLVNVRAHQRLTARQDQYRNTVGFEVVHHGVDFFSAQFTLEVDIGRDRVAVFAGEVAAADEVPDHHRATGLGHRAHRARIHQGLDVAGHAKHRILSL